MAGIITEKLKAAALVDSGVGSKMVSVYRFKIELIGETAAIGNVADMLGHLPGSFTIRDFSNYKNCCIGFPESIVIRQTAFVEPRDF